MGTHVWGGNRMNVKGEPTLKASELKNLLEHVIHDCGDIEVVVDNDDPYEWCPIDTSAVVSLNADGYGPSRDKSPAREALALELF